MNIANYITGSAHAAQRMTAEATLPPLREGYSRQVWGMLKDKLQAGKVTRDRGMWARTAQEVADWQAAIDEAVMAKQEADAVALLTRRGWTCVKEESKA